MESDTSESESDVEDEVDENADDFHSEGGESLDWDDIGSGSESSQGGENDQEMRMQMANPMEMLHEHFDDDYPLHQSDEDDSEQVSEMFNGMMNAFEAAAQQAPPMDETNLSPDVMRNFRNALNATGRRMDYEVVELDEFPMGLGNMMPRNSAPDDFLHPLLRERQSGQQQTTPQRNAFSIAIPDGVAPPSLFDRVFSRTMNMARTPINPATAFNPADFPELQQRSVRDFPPNLALGTTSSVPVEKTPVEPGLAKQIENLHLYRLGYTDERWKQESRIFYGSATIEKALKHSNEIVNDLIPSAMQSFEKHIAEAKAQEELDKLNADNKEPEPVLAEESNDGAFGEPSDENVNEPRQVITIDGNEIDITGTSIN